MLIILRTVKLGILESGAMSLKSFENYFFLKFFDLHTDNKLFVKIKVVKLGKFEPIFKAIRLILFPFKNRQFKFVKAGKFSNLLISLSEKSMTSNRFFKY